MRQARLREIITERATEEKASKENKLLKIVSGNILFTYSFSYSFYLKLAKNTNPSGNLPVLQPLPPADSVSEKACSSEKQQQQPDLQTCLNNSFQLRKKPFQIQG